MQDRPAVSLNTGSGENPALDVLVSGSERGPRLTPAARGRLRLGSVVILVSFAAVTVGAKVQEQLAAAADARRLASLRQVSADGAYGFELEANPPPSLSALLYMKFSLRNDGPRDVTVTRAAAGEFVLLAPFRLPAHTRRELAMRQKVDCAADTLQPFQPLLDRRTPDSQKWPGHLQVTVATPRDTQTITFARPPYDNERVAAICDWLRGGRPERLGGPP